MAMDWDLSLERRRAQLARLTDLIAGRARDIDLDAADIAREFAVSLRVLHKLFEASGTTFHAHLTRVRIGMAEDMLRDRRHAGLNVVEIGFACGFQDASTFYRRFKARHGVTPGQFRAQQVTHD